MVGSRQTLTALGSGCLGHATGGVVEVSHLQSAGSQPGQAFGRIEGQSHRSAEQVGDHHLVGAVGQGFVSTVGTVDTYQLAQRIEVQVLILRTVVTPARSSFLQNP
ncbi:hypothetical protein D9M69_680390 [compost metagenome]